MTKCNSCGKEGFQRIKIGSNKFCSRGCMIKFGKENNPEWISSEYYRMCLDESESVETSIEENSTIDGGDPKTSLSS